MLTDCSGKLHRPCRRVDLRRVRCVALCGLLMVVSGQVRAENAPFKVGVDRFWNEGPYAHILARVSNLSSQYAESIRIDCDLFDGAEIAVGSSKHWVDGVSAGVAVVADVVVRLPPPPLPVLASARCRVTSVR